MSAASYKHRWLKRGLIISIALNLALVGIIAGAVLRFQEKRAGAHVRDRAPHIQALAVEDRRAIRQALRAQTSEAPRVRRAETVQQMIDVLRSEPFDGDALAALMQARREAGRARLERAQSLWLERVAAMSPEARRDYALRIETLVKDGHKRRPGG